MKVKVLYGPAQTKKSRNIKDTIINLAENGEQCILIVPEQFSFSSEQALVDSSDNGGFINAEVLSFMRLSHKLSGEVKGRGSKSLNEIGKQLLLFKAFKEERSAFRVFRLAANKPGFVKIMSDLIAEFKRYGHSAKELSKAADGFNQDSLLFKKTKEIAYLYDIYESNLKQGQFDIEDNLDLLAENIPASEYIANSHIILEEFTGFTIQEYKIIEMLIKHSKSVTISLTMDELPNWYEDSNYMDLFSPVKVSLEKIMKICNNLGVKIEFEKVSEKSDYCKEIEFLESNLFRIPFNKYQEDPKCIFLNKASNVYSEVISLAQSIVKLVKKQDYHFGDITVLSGNPEGYKGQISQVFRAYEIPFFMDSKMPITSSPIIQLILSVLNIIADGWRYRDVFSYLRTGLIDITEKEIDILEEYVIANGLQGKVWERKEPWEFRLSGYFSNEPNRRELEEIDEINCIRLRIVKPILKLKSELDNKPSANKALTAFYLFLIDLDIEKRILGLQESLIKSGYESKSEELLQAWKVVIETMDQIAEIYNDDTLSATQLAELLKISFANSTMGYVPLNMDRVIIGDFHRSRTLKSKALFIIGATEDTFPCAQKTEGILSDNDRELFSGAGIELAPTVRQSLFEEQLITYLGLTSPTNYLSISFPLADGKGNSKRPSSIISTIKRIFPKININLLDENTEELFGVEPAFSLATEKVKEKIQGEAVSILYRELYRWFLTQDKHSWRTRIFTRSLAYDGTIDDLSVEKAIELYGTEILSSVSKMESFAQCPFKFFVEFGLKARERKEFDFKATDSGTLSHDVLELLFKEFKENNTDLSLITREECDTIVDSLLNEVLSSKNINKEYEKNDKFWYVLDKLRDSLKTTAWVNVVNLNSGNFKPLFFELNFDSKGDIDPLEIELENALVYLRGKIDRIDVFEDEDFNYLKVVDYKTGSKKFDYSEVYYGLQLQLIAYLCVILKNLKSYNGKPIKPGAILYQKVDNPIIDLPSDTADDVIEDKIRKELKPSGIVNSDLSVIDALDPEKEKWSLTIPVYFKKGGVPSGSNLVNEGQFGKLIDYVENHLKNIAKDMSEGSCNVHPYNYENNTPCSWCEYKAICFFDSRFKGCKHRKVSKIDNDTFFDLIDGGN